MITRLAPENLPVVLERYQRIYAHGTQISDPRSLVFLSGQIGVAADGEICEGFIGQCHQAMDNVEALLAEVELDTSHILRVVYYVTDASNLPNLSKVRHARWNQGHPPSVTTLVVAGLAAPELLMEIEVTAAR